MLRLDTYLNFSGNTEAVFTFYRSVFGGSFTSLIRYSDMPGSEKMKPEESSRIMHVSLPVGGNTLMGTDILPSRNQEIQAGNNFYISISMDNESEANRVFDALSANGEVILPMNRESWSELFGICKDQYGIQWMINFNTAQQ